MTTIARLVTVHDDFHASPTWRSVAEALKGASTMAMLSNSISSDTCRCFRCSRNEQAQVHRRQRRQAALPPRRDRRRAGQEERRALHHPDRPRQGADRRPRGREVILAVLQSGDYVGEMGLIDNQPRSATVARRGATDMLILGRAAFARCLPENSTPAPTPSCAAWCSACASADRKIESPRADRRLRPRGAHAARDGARTATAKIIATRSRARKSPRWSAPRARW